ncbi:MAG: hypothetical protein IPQ02_05280 [Saprospiraceae bacterium]|uniref:RiboL-PSP-HEPN domain-containing protein n=1 Tax=Candidatus Defluviibacterium haderslevense TaxID=2981993 RepID=A0A9D7S7U5_9BACT|nr:hypothetical protein [Candidatus Defluviibacterium haderslevense]MBL0236030.1 hypothetical protein [Candidatus Defluviibacterium haderslevense]
MTLKHIRRKFLNEYTKDDWDNISKFSTLIPFERAKDINKLKSKSIKNSQTFFLKLGENLIAKGHCIKSNGKYYTFPEPDIILIYFSNAQVSLKEFIHIKRLLLPKLNFEEYNIEGFLHEYYKFYGAFCNTVINLFCSLESFMNSLIPTDFIYERKSKNKTECFNCRQIQECISFDEKMKEVNFNIHKISFEKKHPTLWSRIQNLKEIRNKIVHVKKSDNNIQHEDITKLTLSVNFDDYFEVVFKFMNFYKPNYIQECDCGEEE